MRKTLLATGLPGLFAVAMIAASAIAGCSSSAGNSDAGGGKQSLAIEGSDTMADAVQALATAYSQKHPEITVTVKSADSGSGVSDLIAGVVQIAASSRELDDKEQASAHDKQIKLTRVMIAKDAVAIVVGASNPVTALTLDELKGIFSGTITRWSQLKSLPAKGQDKKITVIGRGASSGTGDYLREHVLAGKELGSGVKLAASSEEVIETVGKQNDAIGFVGMPQAEKAGTRIKIVQVKLNDASPTADQGNTLMAVDYPLTRPLYLLYDSEADKKATAEHPPAQSKNFVEFCQSKDGQKIVHEMGFMVAR